MDPENLNTASQYLNNQLLSRGFLRHGQNINFAQVEYDHDTHIQIIRIVNDLILRHDRDDAQRENMTDVVRSLRAESVKLSVEVERYKDRKNDMIRKLAATEADKNTLESKLAISEAKERRLKSEVEKLKATVGQVRAMCAIDCRKKDRVVEGLKKTILESGRVRGGKNNKVREIVVVGGIGKAQNKTLSMSVEAEGYDLRTETSEFLTELARSLSDDNEKICRLLRHTLDTLKTLSGWSSDDQTNTPLVETGLEKLAEQMEAVIEHVKILLTNPNYVPLEEVEIREEEILRLREGWEHMEQRWKDAVSLIDSWRKRMMCGGEKINLQELQMGLQLDTLMPQKDEPLDFNLSIVKEESEEENDLLELSSANEITSAHKANSQTEIDSGELNSNSSPFEDVCDEDSIKKKYRRLHENKEEFEDYEATCDNSSMSPCSVPQLSPLHEMTSETYSQINNSPVRRCKNFSPIVEENTLDFLQLDLSPTKEGDKSKELECLPHKIVNSGDELDEMHTPFDSDQTETLNNASTSRSETSTLSQSSVSFDQSPTFISISTPQARQECSLSPQKSTSNSRSKLSPSKSIPKLKLGPDCLLLRPHDVVSRQSPLNMTSITAKLTASAREADAARVRAKLRAAKCRNSAATVSNKCKSPDHEFKPSTLEVTMGTMKSPEANSSKKLTTEESFRKDDYECEDFETTYQENSDSTLRAEQRNNRKRKAKETSHRDMSKNRRRKRRSTLTSWELEKFILSNTEFRD
ncbi:putative nima interactive protein [Erysiphe neolycopersici]|uniref:Putative nima interactive protein n=1 Tax=Erysiphe neolycopersici TaxID=212602 RepID=A0A420HJN2_9PEZI|nr:putative nima interactive protein [Erysiphe neolycopersici]